MTKEIDVLIIGAGINGAGLFRDLAEQGVSCAIVDKGDFGSGTSAAPSRMIHGGLKYLETGEFGLVAQSTYERNLLLKNAPHLIKPLETMIPMFSWLKGIPAALRTLFGSKTAARSRGALLIEVGLFIYDFFGSRARVMPRHSFWTKTRAKRELPLITDRIVAMGSYFDARVTAPERLVLELIKDGCAAHSGAIALNYTSVTGQADGVVMVESTTGVQAFRPKIVVNAAGPWIDRVNGVLGSESKFIGGTKGSHVVLDHPQLREMLNGRMIYFETNEGRICLAYEYEGRVMLGTSDIRADNPDEVACQDDEIDYFFDVLRDVFPNLPLDRGQIVYAYSGIRPLPASDGLAVGLISRDHSVPVIEATAERPFDILSLVGGKWTTFRGFAEEVADDLLGRLDRARRISTSELPIGGGRGFSEAVAQTSARGRELVERYGSTGLEIAKAEGDQPAMITNLVSTSQAEIEWICSNERVVHLSDIVIRRTLVAVRGELTKAALTEIAQIAARVLGWSADRTQEELSKTYEMLVEKHRMRL